MKLTITFILCSINISLKVIMVSGWPFSCEKICHKIHKKIWDDRKLMEHGNKLFRQGKYTLAIPYYSMAIAANPAEPSYYRFLGHCYLRKKLVVEAIYNFQKASLQNASNEEDRICPLEILALDDNELLHVGQFFLLGQSYEEAACCFGEAFKKNSANSFYLTKRALCFRRMNEFDKAIADYKEVLRLDPSSESTTWSFIILASLEAGKFEEIIKETFEMNNDGLLMELGDKFMGINKFTEAERCYTELIRRTDPPNRTLGSFLNERKQRSNNVQYYESRGLCYLKMGNLQAAILDFREVLQIEPGNKSGWMLLIQTLFDSGQFDEAIKGVYKLYAYKCLTLRCPPSLLVGCDTWFWSDYIIAYVYYSMYGYYEASITSNDVHEIEKLGDKFSVRGKFDEALICYTDAISKRPWNYSYYERRGVCRMKVGRLDDAISDFRTSLELNSFTENGRYFLCVALFQSGKFEEAVRETFGLEESALAELCHDLFTEQKFREAVVCYKQVIAVARDGLHSARYYEFRGRSHLELNDEESAIEDFRRSLELDPINSPLRASLYGVLLDTKKYDLAKRETANMDDFELAEMGQVFFSQRKFTEAINCYTEAIAKKPKSAKYREYRGMCHVELGDVENAMLDFNEALNLEPSNSVLQIRLCKRVRDAGFDELLQKAYSWDVFCTPEYLEFSEKEIRHARTSSSERKQLDEIRERLKELGCKYENALSENENIVSEGFDEIENENADESNDLYSDRDSLLVRP